VIDLARLLGWRVAHFRPARGPKGWRLQVSGDGAGFPDLVLVHPRHGVRFRELKSGKARLSPKQAAWIDGLQAAGADAGTWYRDEHWPLPIVQELRGGDRCAR
jgi:hypothetical protein